MNARFALVLFLLGMVLVLLAALFKVQHWVGADIVIILGLTLQAAGGVLFLYKLLTKPGIKKA